MTAVPLSLRSLVGALGALAAGSAMVGAQIATADRVQGPGFWPTQGTSARKDFLGLAACAKCHASHARTQPGTSMARTAERAADAATLRENPVLGFHTDTHRYEVRTSGGQSLFSVTGPDGTTASVPLSWAFGAGKVGQTYLFEWDGAFHEARLSYFESLHGADFTPGRAVKAPKDLAEALSRRMPDAEARRCFGCHNTASTAAGTFDPKGLIAGITCEACHGPGRRHVELLEQKRLGPALDAIVSPGKARPGGVRRFLRRLSRDVLGRQARGGTGHRRPPFPAPRAAVEPLLGRRGRAPDLRGLPRSPRAPRARAGGLR